MKQKYGVYGSRSAIDKLDLDELKSKIPNNAEIVEIEVCEFIEDKDDKVYLVRQEKSRFKG